MDITGKIIVVQEARSGTSQRTGNAWMSQEYVIEWTEGQYPRHCNFNVFGEDRIKQFNIQIGKTYTISIDIDAREYQGRWYNDIRAWRVVEVAEGAALTTQATATVAPTSPNVASIPAPTEVAADVTADDLPF